jgi:hypothetical protein
MRTAASRQKLPLHERSFRESACANTFLAVLRGAVRTLSQGLRCPCQSRAEDQATATPVWLWLAEPPFSLCADEGYERSGAIAGNRRPASKIVELGSGDPIQRETHYRRSPVFVSPGAGHPCVKSPGFNPSALTATSGSGPYASTLSFGAIMAAMIAAALAGSPSATKKTERTGGPPPNGSVVTITT